MSASRNLQPSLLPRGVTLGFLVGFALAACGGGDADPGGETTAAARLAADPRVAGLLADCPNVGYYDRFLDDIAPILVEKLESAGGDPLKHAKDELGLLGAPAVPELRRLIERSFSDAFHGPRIENAIDALSLNAAPEAHDVLLRCLDHPMESVRQRALRGLIAHHARAEDYALYLERLSGSEPLGLRMLYAEALFAVEPVRAQRAAVSWFANGSYRPLWDKLGPLLQQARDPEVAARAASVFADVDESVALYLAAPAARGGDVAARTYLRAQLDAADPSRRILAVRALGAAGLVEDLVDAVTTDPDTDVRIFAVQAIADAEAPDLATRLDWIRPALDDESPMVRGKALEILCRKKDPAALDRALADLGENPRRLQAALLALRDPLADPALSRRALAALRDRLEFEAGRSLVERGATYKALGLVQLEEAARLLRQEALAAGEQRIESLRAHEWLMIQASNTGAAGRTYLWNQLAEERDPLRRIDLITASCASRDPEERYASRDRLLTLVEDERLEPAERVYAAERCARIGPAWVVAPRLKLVANSARDPALQLPLQCLLWRWY